MIWATIGSCWSEEDSTELSSSMSREMIGRDVFLTLTDTESGRVRGVQVTLPLFADITVLGYVIVLVVFLFVGQDLEKQEC